MFNNLFSPKTVPFMR